MTKEERTAQMLKTLLERAKRLVRFIELDSPGIIIEMEAWMVLQAALIVVDGKNGKAGTMIAQSLIDRELSACGFCSSDECEGDGRHRTFTICEACIDQAADEIVASAPMVLDEIWCPARPDEKGETDAEND